MAASPEIVGRYAIYGKIASGGVATVHFGRLLGEEGFARTVAIKRLHPHLADEPMFVSTMMDEARLAARIQHPNVVPTLDVLQAPSDVLVVMEYVRGESVARLLNATRQRGQRVPQPIVSAIVVGALQGLHAAHEATGAQGQPLDLIHRDVSPENILVGVDGIPRVIDFGVAKAAGRLQTTGDGALKGKLAYMAPEQLIDPEITRRVDIYAMSAVLWEMLALERLFPADQGMGLFSRVLAGVSVPPSAHARGIPEALDAIVMRGLSKDPAARFATAREMAEALIRVAPPAFPPEVGAWVERVAHDALSQRQAILSAIEEGHPLGDDEPTTAPVPVDDPDEEKTRARPPMPTVPDDDVTIAGPEWLVEDDPPTARTQADGPDPSPLEDTAARLAPRRPAGVSPVLRVAILLVACGVASLLWRMASQRVEARRGEAGMVEER